MKSSDREQYDERTQECIKRLKPKKKSLLSRHSTSSKFNSLIQSILGFLITLGVGILGFMSDKQWAIGIIIFLAVIYIVISWYFYNISDKNDKGDL